MSYCVFELKGQWIKNKPMNYIGFIYYGYIYIIAPKHNGGF